MLVDRGTTEFLCKHFASEPEDEIKEECLLVGIAMLLGGNKVTQDTFYKYMINDKENTFVIAIK